ncbi:uncharacterized protein LOC124264275 [Haliotis rubra]|uniref:uncharacterized protein LOC124264275 n=1 Tax=Haliotis rubra TaxID=36100 RepID=UPI001EE4EB67|nr:uncharacterized protein LOC124264275 [Haliotis rubra]
MRCLVLLMVFMYFSVAVGSITFTTQGLWEFVNPMIFGFDIRGKDWITFRVMACKDFNIKLYFRDQEMYRMLLGGWHNGKSRFFAFGTYEDVSGKVFTCTGYDEFWTSWEDGHFKVGRGNQKDVDILFSDAGYTVPGVDSFTVNAPSGSFIFEYDNCTSPPDIERLEGVRYTGGFVLRTYSNVSGAFCITECVLSNRCFSLSFNRVDSECELFTTPFNATDLSSAPGWESYVFPDIKLYT